MTHTLRPHLPAAHREWLEWLEQRGASPRLLWHYPAGLECLELGWTENAFLPDGKYLGSRITVAGLRVLAEAREREL